MRNSYAGSCVICGRQVAVGAGYFERVTFDTRRRYPETHGRVRGQWALRCRACVGKGHKRMAGTQAAVKYPGAVVYASTQPTNYGLVIHRILNAISQAGGSRDTVEEAQARLAPFAEAEDWDGFLEEARRWVEIR